MTSREEDIASHLPADLDALPRQDGFRLRGMDATRLETFIDAAFAFAITLVVIAGNQVPDRVDSLLGAFRNVPLFILSIAVIGIFWRGHWLWSRRFGLEDGWSVLLSWVLLVTMLIYVYPLKALFGGMTFLLSDGAWGHPLAVRTPLQARQLFSIFALGFLVLAVVIQLLNIRAYRLRDALRLNELERAMTRREIRGWAIPASIGLLSLLLAVTLPVRYINWSGWIYFSLAILVPLHRRLTRRQIPPRSGESRKVA